MSAADRETAEVEFVTALRALSVELPWAVYKDFADKTRAYMAAVVARCQEAERWEELSVAHRRQAEAERDEALKAAGLLHPATAGAVSDYNDLLRRRAEAAEAEVARLTGQMERLEAEFDAVIESERSELARVAELEQALREYHDLMPGLAECANECGAALLYSEAHQANQRARAALAPKENA